MIEVDSLGCRERDRPIYPRGVIPTNITRPLAGVPLDVLYGKQRVEVAHFMLWGADVGMHGRFIRSQGVHDQGLDLCMCIFTQPLIEGCYLQGDVQ